MNPESDDESSEFLNALLTEILAELEKEASTGSLEFAFPLEVAEALAPWVELTWSCVRKSLAAQAIGQLLFDVVELMEKKDSFAWPLDDPQRCLAIVVLHKYYKKVRKRFGFLDEDQEDSSDSADWWKETQ